MERGERIQEQIIIGTPGKMLDFVVKLKVIDPSKIVCLVFDEADVMISQQGHRDQSVRLKKYFHFEFLIIIQEIYFAPVSRAASFLPSVLFVARTCQHFSM